MILTAFLWSLSVWSVSSWEPVPKAERRAPTWPHPRWTEQDLFEVLFLVTHLPRSLPFCWGTISLTLLTVNVGPTLCRAFLPSWLLSITQWNSCSFLPELNTLHLFLDSCLSFLILFPSMLEPLQCHFTGWSMPSTSWPKPLLKVPTSGPPCSHHGRIAVCFILHVCRLNPCVLSDTSSCQLDVVQAKVVPSFFLNCLWDRE